PRVLPSCPTRRSSDLDIPVLDDAGETALDFGSVNMESLAAAFRGLIRDVLEQQFHDGMQPPRADVLVFLVDLLADLGHLLNGALDRKSTRLNSSHVKI